MDQTLEHLFIKGYNKRHTKIIDRFFQQNHLPPVENRRFSPIMGSRNKTIKKKTKKPHKMPPNIFF